jgi:8-amino-7-oxononanoate synthase
MDIFGKILDFTIAKEAEKAGYYPYFLPFAGNDATVVNLGGREVIMCGSNNYLGLTADERVQSASREAIATYGTSCAGSRFLNGNMVLHDMLEAELADFYGKPAALVISTGYQTNLGAIAAIAGHSDVVVLDREAHASLVDGAQLSGAKVLRFRHNDPESLALRLEAVPEEAGRIVAVDGVYSMTGEVCALPEVLKVCQEYGARLLVDDAHGLGVLAQGRGTCAHFGLTDEVDLITSTFSKTLSSLGGVVAGDEDVIHYIRHHARSLIFSAAGSPASTAAALAALRILRAEPWRVDQVLSNTRYIREALVGMGLDPGRGDTPVLSLRTRGVIETTVVWRRLLDRGVYVNPIVPPAGSPGIRLSFMATHSRGHLDRVLEIIAAETDHFVVPTPAAA